MAHFKRGDKVYYTAPHGAKENGVVKSVNDSGTIAFVVYHCDDDWKNYQNYTGAATKIVDIKKGWIDSNGNEPEQPCDHHFIPTNAKWQSVTQMKCNDCGKIIN